MSSSSAAEAAQAALISLPMYDWPELRAATNKLGSAIHMRLQQQHIAAPKRLRRDLSSHDVWQSPELLLSQTCGLPWVMRYATHTQLVATPHYDIDCEPGHYFSHLCVNKPHTLESLKSQASRTLGINATDSLSGCLALLETLNRHGIQTSQDRFLITGSHRQSLLALATGRVEAVAIDAVAWKLASRYGLCGANIHPIARSRTWPALPLITGPRYAHQRSLIASAVGHAIADLEPQDRAELLIEGLSSIEARHYMDSIKPALTQFSLPSLALPLP